jgi:hypothetical protein
MGDVNNDVTTVLERAATAIKDNRLVPEGFSTTHPSYDTTVIAGVGADADFNLELGTEGNGGDIVHYHIGTGGYTGALTVTARVFYQPVPPQWNAEMFSMHGERIDSFRDMYHASDGTPELVAADSIFDLGTAIADRSIPTEVTVFPNPTNDGLVRVSGKGIVRIRVYDATGREVQVLTERRTDGWWCRLPDTSGLYHLAVRTDEGERLLRVVRTVR